MDQKDKTIQSLDDLVSLLDPANLNADQNKIIDQLSLGNRLESLTKDFIQLLTPQPFTEGDVVLRDGHITQWNSDDHEVLFRNGEWITAEGYPVKTYQKLSREDMVKHIDELQKDPNMTEAEKARYIMNIQNWCDMVGIKIKEVH